MKPMSRRYLFPRIQLSLASITLSFNIGTLTLVAQRPNIPLPLNQSLSTPENFENKRQFNQTAIGAYLNWRKHE